MTLTTKDKLSRESNIELLRIIAILGVIILHYNNSNIGGGLKYVHEDSVNYYVLHILQAVFVCGVDLFILISGYFMFNTQKRNIKKPLELIIQVMAFNIALYIMSIFIDNGSIVIEDLFKKFLPCNYFVILYIALYLISPYINIVILSLNKKNIKLMLTVMIILFSFWPTFVDVLQVIISDELIGLSTIGMYGSQWGYSIVNFVLMYVIGASIRKREMEEDKKDIKTSSLLGIFLLLVFLIFVWSLLSNQTAWEYCNPLVILESITVFCLFKKINIGSKKIINSFAKATLTVFLLHQSLFRFLKIENFVNRNVFIMIIHIFISCIALFLVCYVVWLIYDLITKPIFKILFRKVKSYSVDLED